MNNTCKVGTLLDKIELSKLGPYGFSVNGALENAKEMVENLEGAARAAREEYMRRASVTFGIQCIRFQERY